MCDREVESSAFYTFPFLGHPGCVPPLASEIGYHVASGLAVRSFVTPVGIERSGGGHMVRNFP